VIEAGGTAMRNILRTVLIGLVLTISGGVVLAGPFEDGIAAIGKGDYATALRLLRPLAEQGDAKAQISLGAMYAGGQGVAQDYREAVKWYRSAAEQGIASAQIVLGGMYADGRGVAQNYLRAHMWFNLAALKLSGDAGKWATESRDRIAKSLTPAQVVQAQEMAKRCEQSYYKGCD
jgi:uncharacterized protein